MKGIWTTYYEYDKVLRGNPQQKFTAIQNNRVTNDKGKILDDI